MSNTFWIPKTKQQLIEWLKVYYPTGSFNHMNKAQLYAIFYKKRKTL